MPAAHNTSGVPWHLVWQHSMEYSLRLGGMHHREKFFAKDATSLAGVLLAMGAMGLADLARCDIAFSGSYVEWFRESGATGMAAPSAQARVGILTYGIFGAGVRPVVTDLFAYFSGLVPWDGGWKPAAFEREAVV